jgi:hypothetical protein
MIANPWVPTPYPRRKHLGWRTKARSHTKGTTGTSLLRHEAC